MIINHPKLKCTGLPAPREYEWNNRNGVSYKVELSDGHGTLSLPCENGNVYGVFEPFEDYTVDIEITQVARENVLSTRCRVIAAQKV